MRLLFLSNFYPPHHLGGYEELCAEVAAGLKRRGHAVAVLTSDRRVNRATPDENDVYRLLHLEVDPRPYRAALGCFVGRAQRLKENLACLEETAARVQPEVLMVWGLWNLPRQLMARAESWESPKVVYYIADYWPTLPDAYTLHWREPARHRLTQFIKSLVGQVALRELAGNGRLPPLKFEHMICVSQAVRRHLVRSGLPAEAAQIIYNGIDTQAFARAAEAKRALRSARTLRLLYAGRLSPDKGVHTAIEALAVLARRGYSIGLTVIGSGSLEYKNELRRLSRRVGVADRVTFLGRAPRDQMPEVLAQFDVLVMPSVSPDPSPRIVQEAMAAGLAVVGTPVGGVPEMLVDEVNGLMFAPGDAVGLAGQIERLVMNDVLKHKLAEAGFQMVRQRFDMGRMLDELEAYLRQRIVCPI